MWCHEFGRDDVCSGVISDVLSARQPLPLCPDVRDGHPGFNAKQTPDSAASEAMR